MPNPVVGFRHLILWGLIVFPITIGEFCCTLLYQNGWKSFPFTQRSHSLDCVLVHALKLYFG